MIRGGCDRMFKLGKMFLSSCLVAVLLLGYGVFTNGVSSKDIDSKKAIVVVSFGTTFPDSRKACIESVENAIRDAFPDYEVRRAFTSKIVMKRIAEKENLHIDDLEKTLTKLQKEGYRDVIVQTTHLTPGEEFDKKVIAVVDKFQKAGAFDKLTVGRPLLFFNGQNDTPDDFAILANALKTQLPMQQMPGRAIVFMGHGSPHQPNPAYSNLQQKFDAAGTPAVIGVVEETDHPNFEDALHLLKARDYKQVVLMPLMLVAGDHANNDMAGDEKDSWKNQLQQEGFSVSTYIHGLGENKAVQDIYVQHVRDAVLGLYQIK